MKMSARKIEDNPSKRERELIAEIRTLKSQLASFEGNQALTMQGLQCMNQVLLDAMPCVALLLRPQTREIMALNETAKQAGAVLGKCCFNSWTRRDDPCPWCLAPALWATEKAQHIETEALGIVWDSHWLPISDDLYLHYAFDITERKRTEEALWMSNRALTMLTECNQTLVHTTDEGDLLHDTCRILVKTGGYRLAWVGFAEQDEGKSVRPVAQMGYDEGYLNTLNITWADTKRGRGLARPSARASLSQRDTFSRTRSSLLGARPPSSTATPRRLPFL